MTSTQLTLLCFALTIGGLELAVGNLHADEPGDSLLLFEDDFERNESQEVKEEPGGGWSTNSAKRAGDNKQVHLGDGTLHIFRHKTADHAVSVVHPARYKDCRVELRFRIDDEADDLGIDFADMKCKEVHAGHICKIFFRPDGIEMHDLKSGRMNMAFRDAVKSGTATDQQKAAVKASQKRVTHPVELGQWHSAIVSIEGEIMSVELDGKSVGSFSSPGMAHPRKDMIRFSAGREVRLDDVRMFAVNATPASNDTSATPVKHLFVATLLLRRMKSVEITQEQLEKFNRMSSDLRARIDTLRAEAGITNETIKRRDEIYSELKKEPFKGDDLYRELQKRGGFTDAQRDGFQKTQEHYKTFKSAALGLLTKQQRARLPKPGKRK